MRVCPLAKRIAIKVLICLDSTILGVALFVFDVYNRLAPCEEDSRGDIQASLASVLERYDRYGTITGSKFGAKTRKQLV